MSNDDPDFGGTHLHHARNEVVRLDCDSNLATLVDVNGKLITEATLVISPTFPLPEHLAAARSQHMNGALAMGEH
jgi:hypothetical protein